MHSGWQAAPPQLKNSGNRQNHSPHKPLAQLCRSTRCSRLHHTCCTLQRLHLILQWPMACPGLATHTLGGLCALWSSSSASRSGKLQHSAKLHPPQTNYPARPQHPVQPPPHLLHTRQRVCLTLQWPVVCPGLTTHTLAELCALCVPCSVSSSTEKLRKE